MPRVENAETHLEVITHVINASPVQQDIKVTILLSHRKQTLLDADIRQLDVLCIKYHLRHIGRIQWHE